MNQPSNLVVQRERENVIRSDEPTGEPESLAGRIDPRQMGSLGRREKPNLRIKENPDQVQKKRGQQQVGFDPRRKTRLQISSGNVMTADIDENLLYRPKTKETRTVYEKLLALINNQMPDQSQDVIKSVVDEILAVLKNEDTKDSDKKLEIEGLINKISNEFFSDLLLNAKLLTDYNPEIDEQFQRYEEEMRVPVVFDDDVVQEESDEEYQIADDGDDESQEGEKRDERIINFVNMDIEGLDDQEQETVLNPLDIDAYWLHGQLNQLYNDPMRAQSAVNDVLELLNSDTDIQCENGLVSMFGQYNFSIIKMLHRNRHTIYYMTRLMQAVNDEQKDQIQAEMNECEAGQKVLAALSKKIQTLQSKQGSTKILVESDEKEDSNENKLIEAINITDQEFQAIPKKIVELDTIAFQSQGHLMSNEKCHLPPGSYKVSKKGYEEIYIPAVKQKSSKDKLIRVDELPRWASPAFSGFKELNAVQSLVCDAAINNSDNLLICAPTGAGKTNIALLAMLQVIGQYTDEGLKVDLSKFKIVYIAPMKALVAEQVLNFQKRLEPYGIKVAELTGDSTLTKHQVAETQVLIVTPEKWDILTRKVLSNSFIQLVKLIIIDEIHLLHDTRGPVIEAIVARTIRSIEERQELVRLVGLSATLPNYGDVASFLRVKSSGVFYFDNSYRPVPLQQQYVGITEKKPIRRVLLMNEILYEKVSERAGKGQILIFVHSRKDTVKTARILKETAFSKDELNKFLRDDGVSRKVIEEVLSKEDIRSPELRELLEHGFAVHHAGLARSDRDLVEQLFADKHIQVLVSTATLAWGVNLPAHTVIIKGTQVYSPEQSRWVELSPQDILQMMGRAGRPRFDTKGEGIIITTYQELKFYLSLLNMQLPIESQFVSHLADQLNAEIALGSVQTLKTAVNWLGYTYLYIRMLRNPTLYTIDQQEIELDPLLIKKRADLAHSAATILDKHGLIKYDRKTGLLESTILGRIASYYYLKYPSVAVYNQHLKPNMGMIELFKVFSLSQEFNNISIREEEKIELQRLAMSVPVPIKGSQDDPTTKVNVLVQAYISRLKLEGLALNSDMIYITQSAGRLMRALYEICVKREWAQAALTALNMAKMVEKRMWNCMTPLRQFKGLPEEILKRVEKKEGVSWEHLYQMSAQQIGELIRYQNLGKTVHKLIHKFPRIDIHAYAQPITRSCLRIDLQLSPDFQWDEKMHGKQEPFHIFVLDCDCERILYQETFMLKYQRVVKSDNKNYEFSFTVPLFEIMHPIYFIRVVSDRWIACETEQAIPFKNLILPEPFQQVTELLGRSPLPLDIIEFPQIERVLQKKILPPGTTHFDSIQTQVFQNIYNSQESVFIGSPSFKSKHILPYLAALQSFQVFQGEKVVYVSPDSFICEQRYRDFVNIFSKSGVLNLKVAILTGQIANDQKLLEKSDIIISNSQNWDIMSRRWKQRKGFQAIRLFIADDLHKLAEQNSILEVIISRMRMVSSLLDRPIRIVGLALSIADYREVAEWIGATPQNTFNFSPVVRANTLQIVIQGFDQSHRPTRINTMLIQAYPTLRNKRKELSVIYVSDRKQARICALDLLAMANADGISFLNVDDTTQVKEIQKSIKGDTYLSYTIGNGIGFLYECMDIGDEQIIKQLIEAELLNVVIMTYGLALRYNLKAQTVIVLEASRYDGLEKRYVDYNIPEMLEMVESSIDRESTNFMLLVHAPKKEFYKKFLMEPLPVESHLNHYLSVHLNAEIVAKNIHTTQDCIDWLTWTFLYRRLTQNPNYYNLSEVSGTHINNYLSELIENTIEELQDSRCIAVEDDNELDAINSGIIANYYYVGIQTVAQFTEIIKDNSKLKDLLMCLSKASEFDTVQIRNSEESILQKLSKQVNYTPQQSKMNEPNTKAFLLLQAHFHRFQLNSDLKYDLNQLLELSVRLCSAMVDVSSSNLWLRPSILCMQLCQMIVQALWVNTDSPLKQIPYLDDQAINELKKLKIEDIADFMNMEDDQRNQVLRRFSQDQVDGIAKVCNRYPSIEIKEVIAEKQVTQGEVVQVKVILERQGDDYTDFVVAPHFPKPKEEQWWILCADRKSNRLFGNKKITLRDIAKVDLRFQAPEPGDYELTIFAICDSYIGADQVQTFRLAIQKPQQETMEVEEGNNE